MARLGSTPSLLATEVMISITVDGRADGCGVVCVVVVATAALPAESSVVVVVVAVEVLGPFARGDGAGALQGVAREVAAEGVGAHYLGICGARSGGKLGFQYHPPRLSTKSANKKRAGPMTFNGNDNHGVWTS